MDPQQGFRYRFTDEELRKSSRVKSTGTKRIEVKQLERKTQLKVAAVGLLSFFLLSGFLDWSDLYIAVGTSFAIMGLITYRITRDNHYLHGVAADMILVTWWYLMSVT